MLTGNSGGIGASGAVIGISGITPFEERPAGKRLLEDVTKGLFSTVVVYKLDRIGRDIVVIRNFIDTLSKYGISFKSITEPFDTSTVVGKSFIELLGVFAGFERGLIIERSKAGMERIAKEGKYTGGVIPFGYKVNEQGYYEPDEEPIPGLDISPAEVVRKIYYWLAYEDKTLYWIAEKLEKMGIPTSYELRELRKGKSLKPSCFWRTNHIGRLVKNEFYKGIHYWGKRNSKKEKKSKGEILRKVPPLVDSETWQLAVENIRKNRNINRKDHRPYLFSGLIKCQDCGHILIGTFYKTKSGEKKYYRCKVKNNYRHYGKSCSNKTIIQETFLDKKVWEDIRNWLENPQEAVNELIEKEKELLKESSEQARRLQQLQKELESLEKKKERATYTFINGFLTEKAYRDIIADLEFQESKLREEIGTLKELLSRNHSEQDLVEIVMKSLQHLKNIVQDREVIPYELRKSIYKLLIKEIKAFPNGTVEIIYNFRLPDLKNSRAAIWTG